jgi:HEAT repeat protein
MVDVGRRPTTEEALGAIRAIRDAPENFDLKRDLAPFLVHKSNHVAAAAADTVERLEAVALGQHLVDAFLEWMKNPAERDPGCKALTTIAKTLAAMDHPASQVYLAGIRHVQMEASFGPKVDAAAALRGLCAQGLARMSHPDALVECVTLLADSETAARAGAVRAISETGQPAGVLLLRFKASIGDKDEEVLAECFAGLLRLAPADSLEFVASFLNAQSDEIAERAALALGESRLAAAFPLLQNAWEHTAQATLRRTLLLAMAMLRQDEAVEFLLTRLAEDGEKSALDALAALSLYGRDEAVQSRIQDILAKRKSVTLQRAFEKDFGAD